MTGPRGNTPSSGNAYFASDFFRFLRELVDNNNRPWFQKNKSRYETALLRPAVRFVEETGPRLARISPQVAWDARPFGGSVGRIYRDTRFSKDKSPYRTHIGIHFGHKRAEDSESHLPGFYLHLEPGASAVFSGVWRPDPPALTRIRDTIVSDPAAWSKTVRAAPLSEGEKYARVPSGYDPDDRFASDLRRKDFFASVGFRDADVTSKQFGEAFVAACRQIDPLNRFLARAMRVPW